MRRSTTALRLLCGLWLAALVGSWAPHVHSARHAATPTVDATSEAGESLDSGRLQTPSEQISSDDVHHEHSVVFLEVGSDCGFCRIAEERQAHRVGRAPRVDSPDERGPRGWTFRDRLRLVLFERLLPPRAPPLRIDV